MSIVIPSLNYGTVVGRFLVELGDSTDEDNRPDVLPAKGFVTFTPSISYATVQDSEPEPAVLFPQKVIGVLDSEGYLSTAQYDALNNKYFQTVDGQYIPSRRGVSLQATDDFSLNPYDWTWRVDFSLRYPGANFTFPGFDFRLPSEHTLDLVQAIPIETSAGEFSLIGPRGERGPRGYGIEDISATDGIIRIKWEGGDDVTIPSAPLATPTSDGLMPKEDKAKLNQIHPVRVSTTAGTAVYVTGPDGVERLVSYDSGWRDLSSILTNGWTGTVLIRRTTQHVHWTIENLEGTNATSSQILPSFTGFNPSRTSTVRVSYALRPTSPSQPPSWLEVTRGGQLHTSLGVVQAAGAKITEDADDTLPTSLPGTPA